MKRHIRSKHPYVYDQEMNDLIGIRIETVDTPASETKEYLEDVEQFIIDKSGEGGDEDSAQEEADSELEQVDSGSVLNEADPNFEEKIKYFCTKPVSGRSKYIYIYLYINLYLAFFVCENVSIASTAW